MKRLLFLMPFFFLSSVYAAIVYDLKEKPQTSHDTSLGTFEHNGETKGLIISGRFIIRAQDTVTGVECFKDGEITLASPLSVYPSSTTVKNKIQTYSQNNGIKQELIDCINEENAASTKSTEEVGNSEIPGIENLVLDGNDL